MTDGTATDTGLADEPLLDRSQRLLGQEQSFHDANEADFDRDDFDEIVVNAFGGRYSEPAPGRGLYVGLRAGAR